MIPRLAARSVWPRRGSRSALNTGITLDGTKGCDE